MFDFRACLVPSPTGAVATDEWSALAATDCDTRDLSLAGLADFMAMPPDGDTPAFAPLALVPTPVDGKCGWPDVSTRPPREGLRVRVWGPADADDEGDVIFPDAGILRFPAGIFDWPLGYFAISVGSMAEVDGVTSATAGFLGAADS